MRCAPHSLWRLKPIPHSLCAALSHARPLRAAPPPLSRAGGARRARRGGGYAAEAMRQARIRYAAGSHRLCGGYAGTFADEYTDARGARRSRRATLDSLYTLLCGKLCGKLCGGLCGRLCGGLCDTFVVRTRALAALSRRSLARRRALSACCSSLRSPLGALGEPHSFARTGYAGRRDLA